MPHLSPRLPVLITAAFLAAGAAPTTRQPAILEVQPPPPVTGSSRPGLRRVHPGALLDNLKAPAAQTYRVTWSPGDAGVEAGSSLEFEFRQKNRSEPGRLVIAYPSAVREARTAEFTVGGRTLREHGPVTGWRVSLLSGGRRLAERSSNATPPRGTP
jgi:hypothetical protein